MGYNEGKSDVICLQVLYRKPAGNPMLCSCHSIPEDPYSCEPNHEQMFRMPFRLEASYIK